LTKQIVILGSTGSIGRQALQVVEAFFAEYRIKALAAGSNMELLAEQIKRYRPEFVCVGSKASAEKLSQLLPENQAGVLTGQEGMLELASLEDVDLLLVAVTGIHGLGPVLQALEQGTTVALANKETLVTAGQLVMAKARARGVKILPVDSEHSAIFQCLEEENAFAVEKLLLTASGGPFLKYSAAELAGVTPAEALKHPKWQMGVKITIDSAGLINKGLEVIEAHWLFGVPYEKIEVIIHPQSIIHSLVAYEDGSVLAQCGLPDMRIPIQYALSFPERLKNGFPKLDLVKIAELTFFKPDFDRFPGLGLAYAAGQTGGTMPTVYNAANEQAVELFLQQRIKFTDIPLLIEKVMNRHTALSVYNIEEILLIDEWARRAAAEAG
jgi:1-deoxy-D-xylulose-5-phosphate reductoisomerase